MNPLRKLADPLLRTPPHPAPSMDALQARVRHRRDARRRQQLAAMSVFIVVLVGGVALAARQERGIETLTSPPGTTAGTSTTSVPNAGVGANDPAPPIEASTVELVITPGSASVSIVRTLDIVNRGDVAYSHCYTWDLRRWNGSGWTDAGSLTMTTEGGAFARHSGHPNKDCEPHIVDPHATQSFAFDPGNAPYADYDSNAPDHRPTTLELGVYELFDSTARGRFAVTNEPPATNPEGGVILGASTVGLNPGTTLQSVHEVLPTDLIALDDTRVALSWTAPCNSPADHVEVIATGDEVELRLSIGHFIVQDCMGEPDRWVITFDLGIPIAGRSIIARATTDAGDEASPPHEAAPAGSYADTVEARSAGTALGAVEPTSMLLAPNPAGDGMQVRLDFAGCWPGAKLLVFHAIDGTVVPLAYSRNEPTTRCPNGPPTFLLGKDGEPVFGAP